MGYCRTGKVYKTNTIVYLGRGTKINRFSGKTFSTLAGFHLENFSRGGQKWDMSK